METQAFEKFVKPYLTDKLPSEEGIYLFVKFITDEEGDEDYNRIEIDLVDVVEYAGDLYADSESWPTYYNINYVGIYEGQFFHSWSNKINFK